MRSALNVPASLFHTHWFGFLVQRTDYSDTSKVCTDHDNRMLFVLAALRFVLEKSY